MMIPVTRPASVAFEGKRNMTRYERLALVAPLLEDFPNGRIPGFAIRATARQFNLDERTIRRAIVEADAPEPDARAWSAPRELLVRVAMHGGNIKGAYDEMAAEERTGAGWNLPSYSTAYRAVHADPGLQIALAKGPKELERFLLVGVYEPQRRNELLYIDGMHLPFRCQDRYGRLIDDLWLLSVFDAYARAFIAHVCCVGEITGELTALTLLAAGVGRIVPAVELAAHGYEGLADVVIGGVADTLIADNALANKSEVVRDTMEFIGTNLKFARPYRGADKAKQERAHRTLQLKLAALPGYTGGAKTHPNEGEKERPYALPAHGELPRVEAVITAIDAVIEDYNWNHVVSTTGETPFARYLSGPGRIRAVDPRLAWPRMQPVGTYQVHQRGVKLPIGFRTSNHRDFIAGTRAEVRSLPGVPGRTFFGLDGRYRDELVPNLGSSEELIRERHARNSTATETVRSVLREAGERLATEGMPGADEDARDGRPVKTPAKRRAKERAAIGPDRGAAIKTEWQNPIPNEQEDAA